MRYARVPNRVEDMVDFAFIASSRSLNSVDLFKWMYTTKFWILLFQRWNDALQPKCRYNDVLQSWSRFYKNGSYFSTSFSKGERYGYSQWCQSLTISFRKFSTFLKLLQICLTDAVKTAECERSFSALKRINTYLRTTMSDEQLSDLAILSIEKEISSKLVIDHIIDKFASMEPSRKILLQ